MLHIILTGPESSGKTTLAKALAAHFNIPLVEEYARIFFQNRSTTTYVKEDLELIADGQLGLERAYCRQYPNSNLMISDTDVLSIKIWHDEVFGTLQNPPFESLLDTRNKGLKSYYFLCMPQGVEWEPDPLRENPHDRERLLRIYYDTLVEYRKEFCLLRGSQEERLAKTIKRINMLEMLK